MRAGLLLLLLAFAPWQAPSQAPAPIPVQGFEIIAAFPHDDRAFTQGLFIKDGRLYESTGHKGRSTVRIVRLSDGQVLKSASLPPDQFGEGSTHWGDEMISLTWTDGVGYRWDLETLTLKGRFTYRGEGWGLTTDGKRLILSDGTSNLRFLDPESFVETGQIKVTLAGQPLTALNELEWVEGEIFANVWQTDYIARIDPVTGKVKALIDLAALDGGPNEDPVESVLNGIAYDQDAKRLFVTGKNWNRLYEIRLK